MGTPYIPRTGDIAGVDIFGRRRDDGTIDVGTDDPINMPAFPETIEVAGAVWTLEGITENDGPFAPTAKPDLSICWGNYC